MNIKINTNTAIVAAVSIAIAVIIFVLGSSVFEPYKKIKRTAITEAAKNNIYLAADRWLEGTGHKLRIEESGNAQTVAASYEDVVLIFASCFEFTDYSKLIDTIKAGKKVTVFYDKIFDDSFYDFTKAVKNELPKVDGINAEDKKSADTEEEYFEDESNDYFDFVNLGNGILTVTASHYKMQFQFLNDKNFGDAKSVWNYTGALDNENKGIYIVRSKEVENDTIWKKKNDKTLWEILAEKGALFPIIGSILLLIILGFWMSLMPIGKLVTERELHGKSIRERFLAEGRFYKKYNLLNEYLKYFPCAAPDTSKKTTINDLEKLLSKNQENNISCKGRKVYERKIF
ncbi:MAG: hypothetical protein Ta2F_07880 [Termitinemataceae bacterium]|nr:MAG: hypothetical protein Ta2F_07880 [Termitinemataceae bacterium]